MHLSITLLALLCVCSTAQLRNYAKRFPVWFELFAENNKLLFAAVLRQVDDKYLHVGGRYAAYSAGLTQAFGTNFV